MTNPQDIDRGEPVSAPTWTVGRIGFVAFMLALTLLFVVLGTWQYFRLQEKQHAIALIEERIDGDPIPLSPVGEWVGFDAETYNYRPVTLTGTFRHDQSVLVFTSLGEARGSFAGPGYWVMVPMALSGGGTVWINRGFVPQDMSDQFIGGGAGPEGEMTITGIARIEETGNVFTPGPDLAGRVEWMRNIERLNAFLPETPDPLAPVYVDQAAGVQGALPQGGETRLSLPNRHFEYLLTWYSLALLTPIMLVVWWRRGTGAA